jgi:hypothetical protein
VRLVRDRLTPSQQRRRHEASRYAHRRLLAGVAALVAVFASTGSAQQPVSQTLTFVERDNQGTFHFVDVRPKSTRRGAPSVSPGDSFYGNSPLYNAADTQRRSLIVALDERERL